MPDKVRSRSDSERPLCHTAGAFTASWRQRPSAVDTFWYDGGMRPQTPEELYADNEDLQAEDMLIVGDKGKILCDFRGNSPRLLPKSRHDAVAKSIPVPDYDAWCRTRRR